MRRFTGKRTDRFRLPKQIGSDRELGDIIRTTCNGLTYEMRILELIEKGLDHEALFGRNGNGHQSLHMAAHVGTLMPSAAPKRSEIEHERKEKSA